RDQYRRFLTGKHRRGDSHVALPHHLAEQFGLPFVESVVLRFSITASILRVRRQDGELDKASAHAQYLFFGGCPQIVRGSRCSQPARGGNGLDRKSVV